MFNVSLDLSDLENKLRQVTGPDLIRDIAQAVATEAVQPELAKEPYRSTRKPQPFVSAKQRRYFFAALKDGRIEVPYRRTGKIGLSEQHPTSSGMDVVVPVGYSDLVRTKGKQAKYHDPLWPTTDQVASKIENDTAELIGTATVVDTLNKAGLT